jgi:hypothetical protein
LIPVKKPRNRSLFARARKSCAIVRHVQAY